MSEKFSSGTKNPKQTFPEEIGIRKIVIKLFMFVNHKLRLEIL